MLNRLIDCESRVHEPTDEIKVIFDKIQAWKEKAGDLDKQEKMVAKMLKFRELIKIHNVKTALEKLDEIKEEIKLEEDEITILIFTSIDMDWFTNLIVLQGEFLKWFNLNFEGET